MSDEHLHVGAVDRRVAEPVAGQIAMRVEPGTADLVDGTRGALAAEGGGTDLLRRYARVQQGPVERVGHHVQPGLAGALVGALERVDLFDRTVGLDHGDRDRTEPDVLGPARTAQHQAHDLLEQPYPGLLPRRAVPAVEDRHEPVAVRGAAPVRAPRWCRPVGVRQQEVEGRRPVTQQGLVGVHRVGGHVDRAQQTGVRVREPGHAQQLKSFGEGPVAARATGETPVAVVGLRRSVDADPDADAVGREPAQRRLVEQDAIRLDTHHRRRRAWHRPAQVGGQPQQAVGPRQQRFPAVQDHGDFREVMLARMVTDAPGGGLPDLHRHHPGPSAPTLVGHLVDVAVVAGEVAALVNLEDEFAEGGRRPPAATKSRHIQKFVRPWRKMGRSRRSC
jgi:hypothetical protein